jgi:hypothetical protein
VSETQDKVLRKMRTAFDARAAKGASLRFRIAPTITSLTALPAFSDSASYEQGQNLSPVLIEALSADFARGVQDLAAILADLKRIRDAYGDLPVVWEDGYVSVRFAGVDGVGVEGLVDEVGVRRGVVVEDEGWGGREGEEMWGEGEGEGADKDVKMALLFPFAPEEGEGSEGVREMFEEVRRVPVLPLSEIHGFSEMGLSMVSVTSADDLEVPSPNPWATEWESDGSGTENGGENHTGVDGSAGFESLYQFLAECDTARR